MKTLRSAKAQATEVFCIEAGKLGNPKLLLLGGTPALPHPFRALIPARTPWFHVVSVECPGFDNNDLAGQVSWEFTVDDLAEIADGLLHEIGFTGPHGHVHA